MDIAMDQDTHDMQLPVALVTGIDYVRQSIDIRFNFFQGEWFLDTSAGLPYWQAILANKQPNGTRQVDALFKNELLSTQGVKTLKSYSSSLDSKRRYAQQWAVDTEFGPLESQ